VKFANNRVDGIGTYHVDDVVLKIRGRVADDIRRVVIERTDEVDSIVKIDFNRQTVTTQLKSEHKTVKSGEWLKVHRNF